MSIRIKSTMLLVISILLPVLSHAKKNDNVNPFHAAAISYKIIDLESGTTVDSLNPSIALTPASITKVVTTIAALNILGPDFCFSTTIGTDGAIEGGVVKGNLIIRGDADPTLGSVHMGDVGFISTFVSKIKAAGITAIEGDVLVDALCLNQNPTPGKWTFEDHTSHYGSGAFGLSAYDNIASIMIQSGANINSQTNIIGSLHIFDTAKIENRVVVGNDNAVVISTSPYNHNYILTGIILPNQPNYNIRMTITDPPALVAKYMHRALLSAGVKVSGNANVLKSRGDNWQQIGKYDSQPLVNILKYTNLKSNNLYAEHIFRRMGCKIRRVGAATCDAHDVLYRYLYKAGVDTNAVFLYDGCGLAPQNGMSAHFMTQLLHSAYQSPLKDVIVNTFPVAGKEGTVGSFFYGTPLEGRANIKSGSMAGVQSYAGYIHHPNGKEYAFCIIVNNFSGKRKPLRRQIEQLILNSLGL